jgi:ribosomal protein S27AE
MGENIIGIDLSNVQDFTVAQCPNCKKSVVLKQENNRCKCGAMIKVLRE